MRAILEALGLVFVVLLALAGLAAAVAWLRARRALRRIGEALRQISLTGHPPRITLRRLARAPRWHHPQAVDSLNGALGSLSFNPAGWFDVPQIPGLVLATYLHPATRTWAVLHDHPRDDAWLDLLAGFRDGTRLIVSSARPARAPVTLPGQEMRYLTGADPGTLLDRFRSLLRGRTPLPPRRKAAAELVEESYAAALSWRNRRGGPAERAVVRAVGRAGLCVDSAALDEVRHVLSGHELEDLDAVARLAFLERTRLDAATWERIREAILIVHDAMPAERLESLLLVELQDEPEEELLGAVFGRGDPPRAAFERFNAALPLDRRFRKLGEIDAPVPADVYATPGVPRPLLEGIAGSSVVPWPPPVEGSAQAIDPGPREAVRPVVSPGRPDAEQG